MSTVYSGMYFIGRLYDMAGAAAVTSCGEYTSPIVAGVLLDHTASNAADSGEPLPPEERDALQQHTRPRRVREDAQHHPPRGLHDLAGQQHQRVQEPPELHPPQLAARLRRGPADRQPRLEVPGQGGDHQIGPVRHQPIGRHAHPLHPAETTKGASQHNINVIVKLWLVFSLKSHRSRPEVGPINSVPVAPHACRASKVVQAFCKWCRLCYKTIFG